MIHTLISQIRNILKLLLHQFRPRTANLDPPKTLKNRKSLYFSITVASPGLKAMNQASPLDVKGVGFTGQLRRDKLQAIQAELVSGEQLESELEVEFGGFGEAFGDKREGAIEEGEELLGERSEGGLVVFGGV
ncbi:hypothetical protein LOK49_LG02G02890 [Camellia lanceoleosa]|uniref:Uncharacterized protein n=1 Tax=Camellia lanceoleosa TaxID=1840588 RepID=A0ACC0ISU2_9ERIC|nr:hypothetical protein LOK49_LG02G02890 [Camellia lanceoleosa]